MKLSRRSRDYLMGLKQAGVRPVDQMSVTLARQQQRAIDLESPNGPDLQEVRDIVVRCPAGDLPIRLYRPTSEDMLPCCLHFPGGGWVTGSLETDDALCRTVARYAGVGVASVGWRRPPEHAFPAAPLDALYAVRWLADAAPDLDLDPGRIAVMGRCVGGNLALTLAQMAAFERMPGLSCLALLAPVVDWELPSTPNQQFWDGYGLSAAELNWQWSHYIAHPADREHALARPLRAEDLSHLPPVFLATAGFDPCRDAAERLAVRLRNQGVAVTHQFVPGAVHHHLGNSAVTGAIEFLAANL